MYVCWMKWFANTLAITLKGDNMHIILYLLWSSAPKSPNKLNFKLVPHSKGQLRDYIYTVDLGVCTQ